MESLDNVEGKVKISVKIVGGGQDIINTKKVRILIGEKEFDIEEEHGSLRIIKIYGCDEDNPLTVMPHMSNCVRIS